VDKRERETLRLRGEIRSLDVLCEGITEMVPRSGGRKPKVRRERH
jgi:hypothetical protein